MRARGRTMRGDRNRGAAALLLAIAIVVVGAFLALVLNLAHKLDDHAQLLTATDSAALAGARELDGTLAGVDRARQKAQEFAQVHQVDRLDVVVDANAGNAPGGDIVLGHWDVDTSVSGKPAAFTPYDTARILAAPGLVNGVLVRDARDGAPGHNSAIEVYFGGFLAGQTTITARAEAVATGGGPCGDRCPLPVVVPACLVLDSNGNLQCAQRLVFANDKVDNAGFSSLDSSVPSSTSEIIELLHQCKQVASGESLGSIRVSNGNNLNKNVAVAFQPYIGTRIVLPIIDGLCPPTFNQDQNVVGFATFTLRDVSSNPRLIDADLDCDAAQPSDAVSGCTYFGYKALPRIVR